MTKKVRKVEEPAVALTVEIAQSAETAQIEQIETEITAPEALSIYTGFDGNIDSLPRPDNGPYFVATKDGYYIHKPTIFGRALVPSSKPPTTLIGMEKNYKEGCFWQSYEAAPKLPKEIMGQAISFFRGVYARIQTEAEVLIFFHPIEKTYRLFIPEQVCSGASVKSHFDATKSPKDYQLVGTMHSHPTFGAFHSGTDENDAKTFNGLHITVGHVTEPDKTDCVAMISVNGVNFHYNIDVVAEVEDIPEAEIPEWWYSKVEKPEVKTWGGNKDNDNKNKKHQGGIQGGIQRYWGDDDWGGHDSWSGTNKGFDYKAYSTQLGQSVPKSWFKEGAWGKIKPEFWPKAIELVAQSLNEEANKDGYKIDFMVGEILESETSSSDIITTGDALEVALAIVNNKPLEKEDLLNSAVDEVENYIGE